MSGFLRIFVTSTASHTQSMPASAICPALTNQIQALAEAQEVKRDRFAFQELGKNKTLLMIFFNNSLRTRLSTQKAATNLGMNVIVLDVNAGAWKLETERGVIMDGDKSELL